jgi:alkanesulfonate monooxygenase SsuD/methylene tetrahydromethanopterin reductase-like flavin-dependent oxidoreductase (luciferase family)
VTWSDAGWWHVVAGPVLSGGRLVLTVGAAFPGRFGLPQHALSDVPWERRFTRLDETVALWRQLWAPPEGGGSFQGSLLRFEELPPMTAPHIIKLKEYLTLS